ncbi:MAG: GIY-YIG nuclease family protein [Patescibacteria group bacterium]|jgi:putative endonuclease
MNYYVYLIHNKKHDKFYIGQTYDVKKRLIEHNSGLSTYTAKYDGEWIKVYEEKFKDRGNAMRREKFLKAQKSKLFYKNLCRI